MQGERAIAGYGIFSRMAVKGCHPVVKYTGQLMSGEEVDALTNSKSNYVVHVDGDIYIDGSAEGRGNEGGRLNSSCQPNCELVTDGPDVWVYALAEGVDPDAEFTVKYDRRACGKGEEMEWEICLCGKPGCEGFF